MVRDTAHAYAQDKLMPRITDAFRHENDRPVDLPRDGRAGPARRRRCPAEYGGSGLNYVCYGLIAREIERVDSGYRSMMSVQSSLVMFPDLTTTAARRSARKYLPKLATGEWIGCFGLTEPNHGSDPGSMVTRARSVAGGYQPVGRQDVDLQLADRRRVRRLGQGRPGRHPRLHPGEGHEGPVGAEDRRQVLAARVDHRRDRDGRRVRARGEPAAERAGPEGAVRLPQQRALRHRVGRAGRRRVLLARGAAVHARPHSSSAGRSRPTS